MAAPRLTIARIWVLRFGMEPRLYFPDNRCFGCHVAIGERRVSNGALKCAATKATSKAKTKPKSTAARFEKIEPAATNSKAKSKTGEASSAPTPERGQLQRAGGTPALPRPSQTQHLAATCLAFSCSYFAPGLRDSSF